ncbi:MAG TPA: hypothetical protein DD473_17705 [Planctomycetaceae bacterium]|nr:hypothetical protein [Planctomycetaceae bacterium]|tara:strand:+ start:831 stop:1247 length:417 start_codon:yes stop_codon:yes gene_type:complete
MQLKETLKNTTRKDLQIFAVLQFFFVSLICFGLFRADFSALVIIGLILASLIPGLTGVLKPKSIWPIYRGWMIAVFPIGFLISHLLMGIVYFGVITPIGLYRRFRYPDPLQRKLDRETTSYWQPISKPESTESYFRQF